MTADTIIRCTVCGCDIALHAKAEVRQDRWSKEPMAIPARCLGCPYGQDFHEYRGGEEA